MPWQINFQTPATPLMEGIVDLHHDIMSILFIILVCVLYTLGYFLYSFDSGKTKYIYNITHNTKW